MVLVHMEYKQKCMYAIDVMYLYNIYATYNT